MKAYIGFLLSVCVVVTVLLIVLATISIIVKEGKVYDDIQSTNDVTHVVDAYKVVTFDGCQYIKSVQNCDIAILTHKGNCTNTFHNK